MVRPGMFISDRYEIIDKVGSGGMADVYKAKCHRLNRFVAIKILKPEYSDDKKFVEKFRGEAQSAAGLSHPNIVNVYDVGEDDGLYYIVMELVEGITLKSFIERKGKLEVKEAVGIAIQIAQGMEAAHQNRIIHRDIKPQNIIISRDGKVKVTDFGIAKATTSNTITSNAMGSVHYISPEQARGGYSDEKSDIYSLGITIYEMLCGRVPFAGENTVSVALLHIQGEAMPLRDLEPTIPVSVDRIVQKCMQKKPERRYLSAGELIADLKKAITNPNGDFVKIAPIVVSDSPTINISDGERNQINTVAESLEGAASKTEKKESVIPPLNKEPEEENETDEEEEEEETSEEESDVDPKLEKIVVAGGIVVAVILALIIIFLVAKVAFSGSSKKAKNTPEPSQAIETIEPTPEESVEPEVTKEPEEATAEPTNTPKPSKVSVPALEGQTYETAQQMLKNAGLPVGTVKTEESDEYDMDKIIRQSPVAGTEVEPNTKVDIVVSAGIVTFPLVDVYGKQKTEAETILNNNGLIVGSRETAYSSTVPEGMVIETKPEKGSMVSKNTSITIVISKGPELVYVPSLVNLTEEQAVKAIEDAGLDKKVTYTNSETVEEGKVISANYSANQQVEKGTRIDITVSLGPKVVETTYRYVANNVNISYNPFEYEDETGDIMLVLTHGGMEEAIDDSVRGYHDFPLALGTIEGIEGCTETTGTITMYLNGEEVGEPITITFVKVEE